jgi:hypothetical protein
VRFGRGGGGREIAGDERTDISGLVVGVGMQRFLA